MVTKAILLAAASCVVLAACSSTPSRDGFPFPKARYDTQYCKNKTCEVAIIDPGCDIFGTCTADLNYYTTILVAGDYRYRVVFRDAYHVYTIDPWIVNGR